MTLHEIRTRILDPLPSLLGLIIAIAKEQDSIHTTPIFHRLLLMIFDEQEHLARRNVIGGRDRPAKPSVAAQTRLLEQRGRFAPLQVLVALIETTIGAVIVEAVLITQPIHLVSQHAIRKIAD